MIRAVTVCLFTRDRKSLPEYGIALLRDIGTYDCVAIIPLSAAGPADVINGVWDYDLLSSQGSFAISPEILVAANDVDYVEAMKVLISQPKTD